MIHLPLHLDAAGQNALLADIRAVIRAAPLYTPRMPKTGKPMSVRMTNCGPLGWVTDQDRGYRYQATHPETGALWPAMPETLLALWRDLARYPHPPEACLVNYYARLARMGMHQDRDEDDFDAPVLSVSLGDTALFRMGGKARRDATRSFDLQSGDVMLLDGEDRLAFHGVDRIVTGSSDLLPEGGRINLTLRRVTKA